LATPKPRYTISPPIKRREVKDDLRSKLLELCPVDLNGNFPDTLGSAKESLVDEMLVDAAWAIEELSDIDLEVTTKELSAIRRDLLKSLKKCQEKLRTLIPDYDCLLGIDIDPVAFADNMDPIINSIRETDLRIASLRPSLSRKEKEAEIALEMTARISNVLRVYGIKPSATKSMEFEYVSTAVKFLEVVGDAIGLDRQQVTWRDIILKSKK
jgi:hypothetical protein